MRISIGNTISLTDISLETKQWFVDNLTFENPKYQEALDHGRSVRFIPKNITMFTSLPNGIVVPRGMLQTIEGSFFGKGYNIDVSDLRILLEPINIDSKIVLRDYQQVAKRDILRHSNGILVAPAGSGKTIMGIDLIATLKQKAIWITHTKRLLDQAIDRITAVTDISKNEVGIIGDGKWSIGNKITIALVQTLVRNQDKLLELGREFGLVIIDEVHHAASTTFTIVSGYFSSYYMYGLTATIARRDKLEPLIYATVGNTNSKIARTTVKSSGGIITPHVFVRNIQTIIDETNDYHKIINDIIIPNENRSNIIASDVIREAQEGHNCIVICTRKIYCEILYEKIHKVWDRAGVANGDQGDKHNATQITRLENGEISVLITTFDLLGEGFDVPKLDRGFLALPFREKTRVIQAVGRIQRTCVDKDNALLYDYVDINIGILNNQFRHRQFVYEYLGMGISYV